MMKHLKTFQLFENKDPNYWDHYNRLGVGYSKEQFLEDPEKYIKEALTKMKELGKEGYELTPEVIANVKSEAEHHFETRNSISIDIISAMVAQSQKTSESFLLEKASEMEPSTKALAIKYLNDAIKNNPKTSTVHFNHDYANPLYENPKEHLYQGAIVKIAERYLIFLNFDKPTKRPAVKITNWLMDENGKVLKWICGSNMGIEKVPNKKR